MDDLPLSRRRRRGQVEIEVGVVARGEDVRVVDGGVPAVAVAVAVAVLEGALRVARLVAADDGDRAEVDLVLECTGKWNGNI